MKIYKKYREYYRSDTRMLQNLKCIVEPLNLLQLSVCSKAFRNKQLYYSYIIY